MADDGKTIEQAITALQGAIQAYVQSLAEDGLPIPVDKTEHDLITTTQITLNQPFQFA